MRPDGLYGRVILIAFATTTPVTAMIFHKRRKDCDIVTDRDRDRNGTGHRGCLVVVEEHHFEKMIELVDVLVNDSSVRGIEIEQKAICLVDSVIPNLLCMQGRIRIESGRHRRQKDSSRKNSYQQIKLYNIYK